MDIIESLTETFYSIACNASGHTGVIRNGLTADKYYYIDQHNLFNKLETVSANPGDLVFFHRESGFVTHIGIIADQTSKGQITFDESETIDRITLENAKILQAIPPPVGVPYKSFDTHDDIAGIRICTIDEFIMHNPIYTAISIGYAPNLLTRNRNAAANMASAIFKSGESIKSELTAVYSLKLLDLIAFIKYHDPNLTTFGTIAELENLLPNEEVISVYCGDLIGRILNWAGWIDLPKVTGLTGNKVYTSYAFYDWCRKYHTIHTLIHII